MQSSIHGSITGTTLRSLLASGLLLGWQSVWADVRILPDIPVYNSQFSPSGRSELLLQQSAQPSESLQVEAHVYDRQLGLLTSSVNNISRYHFSLPNTKQLLISDDGRCVVAYWGSRSLFQAESPHYALAFYHDGQLTHGLTLEDLKIPSSLVSVAVSHQHWGGALSWSSAGQHGLSVSLHGGLVLSLHNLCEAALAS